MLNPIIRLALVAAVVAGSTAAAQPRSPESGRVIAIGDVHGSLAAWSAILKATGLIDDARRWTGGTATLVQTGDLTDRGRRSPRRARLDDGPR